MGPEHNTAQNYIGSIFINIVGLGNVDLVEDIVADDYCLRNITPVVQFSLGTR